MNALESLLILNAVTGWSLSSLAKALNPDAPCEQGLCRDDIVFDKIRQAASRTIPSASEKLSRFSEFFSVEDELKECSRKNIAVIPFFDSAFPEDLRRIHAAPLVLYVKGLLPPKRSAAVAVVGSRRCTPHGRSFAFHTARELASRGITIVSGLAYGIDAEAHRGALEAGGRTVAVLGNGLSAIYPKGHEELAGQIAASGALISEFPLNAKPLQAHFPRRNRIISAMSHGVLVVEAAENSGSLITAKYAAEQGKDVFAVPGRPSDAGARGTNALIRDGARLTVSPEDILEELSFRNAEMVFPLAEKGTEAAAPRADLSPEENSVLARIGLDPLKKEEIALLSGTDASKVSHILLTLELKKYIKVYPGNRYGLNYRRLTCERS
jgi:DNA processing protein